MDCRLKPNIWTPKPYKKRKICPFVSGKWKTLLLLFSSPLEPSSYSVIREPFFQTVHCLPDFTFFIVLIEHFTVQLKTQFQGSHLQNFHHLILNKLNPNIKINQFNYFFIKSLLFGSLNLNCPVSNCLFIQTLLELLGN